MRECKDGVEVGLRREAWLGVVKSVWHGSCGDRGVGLKVGGDICTLEKSPEKLKNINAL